jgi:hypothetical protein
MSGSIEKAARVQLFQCSSALILATLVSMIQHVRPARRRILLISNHSRYAEVENWFLADPELRAIAEETFDSILFLNDLIFPTHPNRWRHEAIEQSGVPMEWFDVEEIDELFVDSIQVPPALTLVNICPRARIHVHSDGLMVYSPTRIELPADVLRRIGDVFFIDYLPGIRPVLLEEAGPRYRPLAPESLRTFFDRVGATVTSTEVPAGTVLFLGQAFDSDRVMGLDSELALYLDGLLTLAGEERMASIAFKPHSRSPLFLARALASQFRQATGRELSIVAPDLPLEAVLASTRIAAVVGVFSTALFTATRVFDVPAFKFCPKDVLYALKPFANSNRIPLIAADIYLSSLHELVAALRARPDDPFDAVCQEAAAWDVERARVEFTDAQVAVGYHMQPVILRRRKAEATRIVERGELRCLDLYLRGAPSLAETKKRQRRRVIDGAIYRAMSPLLPERKARKLKRSPGVFFGDSKHLSMRALGRLYATLTR